jgi:lipid A 4'-phosphatase
MSYLKLERSWAILACFVTSSLFFVEHPAIDVYIANIFFYGSFILQEQWWHKSLHAAMPYFLGGSLLAVVGTYLFNRVAKRNAGGIDGKRVLYLFLVLLVGAGLIVNVLLKDNFGRARPRDIEEFGGGHRFTPAFVVSQECDRNCSFSSGEGAGGFFATALALALSRKRAVLLAALGFGALVSLSRVAGGAHFFSDVVVSFFVMLIVTDILYHYIILNEAERLLQQQLRLFAAEIGTRPVTDSL